MSSEQLAGTDAPNADEFEVSIFGPGKGEAIAVHLGGGDWITVDSCLEQKTKRHPVLDYFEAIGVDPSTQIRLVVGTHAHDDHIAGISSLFEAAETATFVSSPALTSEEFFRAVAADADIEAQLRQTVRSEFTALHNEVKRRGIGASGKGSWMRAYEQRPLWSRDADDMLPGAAVLALSPSDVAIQRAETYLAEGSAGVDRRRRLSVSDPNEFSVALWVSFGGSAVLLGADLENGPAGCGWQAVVQTHQPETKAGLLKVPHHGSPRAHYQQVWDMLLTAEVVSVLAPFRNGSVALPSEDDSARLLSLSSAVYATASPDIPSPPAAVHKISAVLSAVAQNVREPYGLVGHVRARLTSDQQWAVDLGSPARKLG